MSIKTFVGMMIAVGAAIMLQVAAPASAKSPQAENRLKGVQYLRSETSPDLKLEEAIRKTMPDYNPASSDDEVSYFYNRVDLNGDGKMEVIAHLVGRSICGTGGCDTLIFQPTGGGYRLVSTIILTNTPIIVSPRQTRGWNDLVIFVVGGGIQPGHYVTLRFNGRAYPDDPTALPKMRTRSGITGTAYIADDDMSPGKGIRLQPARR
jgi:hypothetical protein